MHSIYDLNNWSNQSVSYVDDRPYSIVFSANSPANQTVSINEGDYHVVPVGTNILDVIAITGNVTYTLDVSSVEGATVTWLSSLPSGVTSTLVSSGVYRLTGVNSVEIWNQVKSPIVEMPPDFANSWVYTATIGYPSYANATSKSWTVDVNVTDISEITTPGSLIYNEDQPTTISDYPQITDTENVGDTYTIVVSSTSIGAVRLITSAGSGGLTSFNTSTHALTIVGTKTQVNSHLASLTLTTGVDYADNFVLNYSLSKTTGLHVQVSQSWFIGLTNSEVINIAYDRSYVKHGVDLLFPNNVPQIAEVTSDTYTVELVLSSNIGIIATGETLTNPANWTASSNSYSYSGTRVNCNNKLASLRFLPHEGISSNATVTYNQYRSGDLQVSQTFNLYGSITTTSTVPSANLTLDEDASITNQYVLAYPHYSRDVAIVVEPLVNGSASNTSTYFTASLNGWGYIGTQENQTGLYRNYLAPASVGEYLYNMGNIAIPTLPLYPDTTTNFTLRKRLVEGGQWANGSITGGNVITGNTNITINSVGEYVKPTSLSGYIKDNISLSGYQILDGGDNRTYTFTITDTGNLGSFKINGVTRGNTFSYTGTKETINSYLSGGTWKSETAGTTTLQFSLTRTSPFTSVIANQVTTSVTVSTPTYGAIWQGGVYVGIYGSVYLIADTSYSIGSWTTATTVCNGLNKNGYDDWFLPNQAQINVAATNKPNLYNNSYWTSSTSGSNGIYLQTSATMVFGNTSKTTSLLYRAMRVVI